MQKNRLFNLRHHVLEHKPSPKSSDASNMGNKYFTFSERMNQITLLWLKLIFHFVRFANM